MLKKITLFMVLLFLCSLNCEAISAQGYALVEGSTGRLIKGQNTDQRLPMASTTKIMTGLLACESGQFDTIFTVPEEAIRIEGSSMGLLASEKLTLRDLTYGLLLESGNDAANTIAFVLEGSVSAFAEKMNARAAQLGLQNTHFANPSGLDDSAHYTTALDLARLGAIAMKNKQFAEIVSTYTAKVPYNGMTDGRILCNHNELLKMYDGTLGIKTGYTRRSGRCLVSCAARNGVTLVAATLNGHEDWDDHISLLNHGFETLKLQPLLSSYPELSLNVIFGESNSVACSYNTELTAALSDAELSRVKLEAEMPEFAYAPITQGEAVGKITIKLDDYILAETDILADESVNLQQPEPGLFEKFRNFFLPEQ